MARNAESVAKGSYYWYEPEALTHAPPDHPLYDPRSEEPPSERLVQSLLRHGMRRAMMVRREGDELLIVDGRRRHRAAEEACRRQLDMGEDPTVRCKVEFTKSASHVDFTIGNQFSKPWSITARAAHCARLAGHGVSVEELAELFARKPGTIRDWLSLAAAPPALKRAVDEELVAPSLAYQLAGKSAADIREALSQAAPDAPLRGARGRDVVRGKAPSARMPVRAARALFASIQPAPDRPLPRMLATAKMSIGYVLGEVSLEEVRAFDPGLADAFRKDI